MLEVASTVLLAAECVLKLVAEGGTKFVAHWLNRVDVAVVLLSLPVLAASPFVLRAVAPAHTVAGGVVLSARFCVQQLRFLCVLKKFVHKTFPQQKKSLCFCVLMTLVCSHKQPVCQHRRQIQACCGAKASSSCEH